MSSTPAVVVKKSGFLNGLFYGFFGFLITTVLCATGLAVYGLSIADSKAVQALSTAERLVTGVPEWVDGMLDALPPVIADALHDRRDPSYRQQVDVTVRPVRAGRSGSINRAAVEVTNNGPETISLMAVRVVLLDDDGAAAHERVVYVATPLAIEDEWRGPLLPGSTRKLSMAVYGVKPGDYEVSHEITELRVWQPEESATPEDPAELTEGPDDVPAERTP
jgi:hypothetical protein